MQKSIIRLKYLSFGCTVAAIIMMVAATIFEKFHGNKLTEDYFYHSPLFIGLWIIVAVSATCYCLKRKIWKRPATFLIHCAFILILTGAAITFLFGKQGYIHLRNDVPAASSFVTKDNKTEHLPFTIQLQSFDLIYYMGSSAPMDYVSTILINDNGTSLEETVSMNNICRYKHYRFYQSGYDADKKGTTLSVAYDPYGISITYSGYILLFLAFVFFFFEKKSYFKKLYHNPLIHRGTVCLALIVLTSPIYAQPKTLPEDVAEKFGTLYVYYNDRVCPLQTLANDFTTKLYGKTTYKGLSAEQVLTGWLFYYDDWKEEPMIKIKGKDVQHLLGISGQYASLTDFADSNGYKLTDAFRDKTKVSNYRNVEDANEKFNLICIICGGNALKLYPWQDIDNKQTTWFAITDNLPENMPAEQWKFIRYSMSYLAEEIAKGNFQNVNRLLEKIRTYQKKEAENALPSDAQISAERVYNSINQTKAVAIVTLVLGLFAFIFYCYRMIKQHETPSIVTLVLRGILMLIFCFLVLLLTLRGYISGHLPLSNGYETMQFMAACATLAALILCKRFEIVTAFGLLISGLSLLVAMMGAANPPITPLMPVLSSPLLSIHVVTIMTAYVLLAFTMLNGMTAIILNCSGTDHQTDISRLKTISHLLLYPAVFLLAFGIFIGAIWANVSWGRYWGWDPKEVWALITMLVYMMALHTQSLPRLNRPMFFHYYMIFAFLSVLITYFGVNFLLGGLHSYAG